MLFRSLLYMVSARDVHHARAFVHARRGASQASGPGRQGRRGARRGPGARRGEAADPKSGPGTRARSDSGGSGTARTGPYGTQTGPDLGVPVQSRRGPRILVEGPRSSSTRRRAPVRVLQGVSRQGWRTLRPEAHATTYASSSFLSRGVDRRRNKKVVY